MPHSYVKKVWTDNQSPMAEVWRDGHRIEKKSFILFNHSIKNQERKLKRCHKWADNMIDMLRSQETEEVGGNLFQ
jgi:hypothetical protein